PTTQRLLEQDQLLGCGGADRLEEGSGVLGVGRWAAVIERDLRDVDGPHCLLQRLGEVPTQGHRLPDAFHRGGQSRVRGRELLEREPGDLDRDVVQSRLERSWVEGRTIFSGGTRGAPPPG